MSRETDPEDVFPVDVARWLSGLGVDPDAQRDLIRYAQAAGTDPDRALAAARLAASVDGCCRFCAATACAALMALDPGTDWPALVAAAGEWDEDAFRADAGDELP